MEKLLQKYNKIGRFKRLVFNLFITFFVLFLIKEGNFFERIKIKYNIFQKEIPSSFQDRIEEKLKLYEKKTSSGINPEILLIGNSNTRRFNWNEYLNYKVFNRSIDGIGSFQLERILKGIENLNPKYIFLLLGINDIYYGIENKKIINNIENFISSLKLESEQILFLQSSFFVSKKRPEADKVNKNVLELNQMLDNLSNKFSNVIYLDINSHLSYNNYLSDKYTYDGVHLNMKGYMIWLNKIKNEI